MKKHLYLLFTIGLLSTTSCRQTRYITEQYIKTQIEEHKSNQFSQIKTYSIFKGVTTSQNEYIEFTGYKYNNQKGMVIGADRVHALRARYPGDAAKMVVIDYIELTEDDCQKIIDNYDKLLQQLQNEKAKIHEELYADFTVNDNLFISLHKAQGPTDLMYINLWIKNEKYMLSTYTLMKKLREFLKY